MPDRTLGRYELISELGRGANGVVWKARHTLLPDRLVALKVLSESLWSSDQARRRFLQEAIAVSRLDHPGIATLYDAEEIDGQLYIAFKLIDGETVARQTASGPLPVRRAVSIARDGAEALAHAHDQGVIHRDLSAGNVMVDRGGRGILVDFGLARSGQSLTQTSGVIVGTLPFMAPEVLRGGTADARSDIYGLGAVLYRMLTGRAPFEGAGVEELSCQILHGRPAPPSSLNPSVSPELDDIVLRALERDARDRYASAREMAAALGQVVAPATDAGSTVVVMRPSKWLSSIRRTLRRRSARWAVTVGSVGLTVAVGLGIAWTRGWRPGFLARTPVVAVIPVRNASEDTQETSYLREAFGENLVTRLGQVPRLRLVPWMTTQRFTDVNQRPEAIGAELHADKLVVGTYRSDGERVTVTMALVDVKTGLQSWSQTYDEDVEDLFALQQSVAIGVASQLRSGLTGTERERLGVAGSRNADAYEMYLRGADLLNSQDPQAASMAAPFFERALKLDPTLAEAWVGVGAAKSDLYFRGLASSADLDAAKEAFQRALALNPHLYAAKRGLIRVFWDREKPDSVLTVGNDPDASDDAEALLVRGWAYALSGLSEKAVPVLDRALEIDPASQSAAWIRVVAESFSGNPRRAVQDAKTYMGKFGEDPEMWTWLGVGFYNLGEPRKAQLCITRALELFGEEQSNLYSVSFAISLYRQSGNTAQADSLLRSWQEITSRRLRAFPDNRRLLQHVALIAGLGGQEAPVNDAIASWERGHEGAENDVIILGGIQNASQFRRACRALQGQPELGSNVDLIRSGSLRLLMGERYQASSQLPEFKRLMAAINKRHEELMARY
jgi:eukaryotic-like serine/threonine-protein kinase